MDLRTFIAALVASLAWPLTALIGLLLVRKIIASLVPLVRTLKYSDIEVSFGREVTETRNAADAAAIKPVSETSRPQRWDDLIRLASVRPRSAIRNASQSDKNNRKNLLKTAREERQKALAACLK